MAIRTGSLSAELAREDPEILDMLLEDYKLSQRRDRSSRADFASGWLAAARRLSRAYVEGRATKLLGSDPPALAAAERVPW